MNLEALLGCKCGLAAVAVLTQEWLGTQVDEHMLLQVGLLSKLLAAVHANVLLVLLMNLAHMPVEGVLGAEDELALEAVQLARPLVHLLDMLPQGFWIQVHLSAAFAGLLQGLLCGVDSVLVLDQAVVGLEAFAAVPA